MASESFEQRMERACRDKEIPGAILVASDREGKFRYEEVFGNRSLKDPSKSDPMTKDVNMWIASCSKFPTSVAAMQCVERGQLSLDDDVTGVLPELKGLKILKKFDEGAEPVFVENTKPITLRHFLTHSSGMTYDIFNPMMVRYRIAKEQHTPSLFLTVPLVKAYTYPLIFEPGDSWEYSCAIDWVGIMVERVSGMDLEAYFTKYIWSPLGVTSVTFHPKKDPAFFAKLADMSIRTGGFTPMGVPLNPEAPVAYCEDPVFNPETPDCSGGAGLYASPIEYQKLLHSICADDGKILKKETVDLMFQDHLSAAAKKTFNERVKIPEIREVFGAPPSDMELGYGLGGMIFLKDVEGGRRAGSLAWGGHPNLVWFIDRKAGISAIFGSQIQPPGDPKFNKLAKLWEQELYKDSAKLKL